MRAVARELMRPEDRLVLLLTPPFERSDRDPGYIRGYPPGVRENGGQYTHAAAWVGWAFAALGDGTTAHRIFDWLNPVRRAGTPRDALRYRVEPYVTAADVCGAPPHLGRGGWTWYTGSAAWLYRLGVEAILGIDRRGDRIRVRPCLPRHWEGARVRLRVGTSRSVIEIENRKPSGDAGRTARLDGRTVSADGVRLPHDGREHEVRVTVGGG
jgi:cellobiose phosphorylase